MTDDVSNLAYKDIVQQQPGLCYSVGLDNRVIGCNFNDAIVFGCSHPDELIGKSLYDFIDPKYIEDIIANNQAVISSREQMVFEESNVSPDGELMVFISVKAPLYDSSGEVYGVVGIAQDVSQIYQQSHTLRSLLGRGDSRLAHDKYKNFSSAQDILLDYFRSVTDYYEGIIACMPGNVFWVDVNGKLIGINDNNAASLGYSRQELVGRYLHEFLPDNVAALTIENNKKIIESKVASSLQESVTLPDGSERTYFSTKRPLFGEGDEVVGVLGTAIDISERKRIEKEVVEQRKIAERASEAKTEFLLNMSHDLRTPCSGILGYAKIMHDQEEDPEKKKMLNCITQSSQHLLGLLNEILDYTRVDASLFEVRPRTENIRELLSSIIELLAAETERKGLSSRLICADNVAENYVFDPIILHRVVLNLLSNAIKFSDSGQIDVMVEYNFDEQFLYVKVKDQGIGIDEKDKIRIFDKFTKVSNSYSGIHQGTGLGLATIVRLLDSVNGSIRLESKVGVGSTFIVGFPVELPQSGADEQKAQGDLGCCFYSSAEKGLDLSRQSPIKVLVVEDDHISKQVTNILLNSMGFESIIVSSGHEALCENLAQFDMVIMDIGLPDMDGRELVVRIREWEQEHGVQDEAIIVAVTAHVDYKAKGEAALGFNAVMQKPLTMEKLELLVKNV